MKKNILLIFLVILLAFVTFIFYSKNFISDKTSGPGFKTEEVAIPTLTETEEKLEVIARQGGEIPFDYEVVLVEGGMVRIENSEGGMYLKDDPSISVYRESGGNIIEATFTDLAVGQKLRLERTAPPNPEIKVYILE